MADRWRKLTYRLGLATTSCPLDAPNAVLPGPDFLTLSNFQTPSFTRESGIATQRRLQPAFVQQQTPLFTGRQQLSFMTGSQHPRSLLVHCGYCSQRAEIQVHGKGESSSDCGSLRVGHWLGFLLISKESKTFGASKVPPYERQPEEGLQMYMQVHGSSALEGSHEKAPCMTQEFMGVAKLVLKEGVWPGRGGLASDGSLSLKHSEVATTFNSSWSFWMRAWRRSCEWRQVRARRRKKPVIGCYFNTAPKAQLLREPVLDLLAMAVPLSAFCFWCATMASQRMLWRFTPSFGGFFEERTPDYRRIYPFFTCSCLDGGLSRESPSTERDSTPRLLFHCKKSQGRAGRISLKPKKNEGNLLCHCSVKRPGFAFPGKGRSEGEAEQRQRP